MSATVLDSNIATPFAEGVDFAVLRQRFRAAAPAYASAQPFPNGVFRGLFDDALLQAAEAEFPAPDAMSWTYGNRRELKSAENRWDRFGPATRALVAELQSGPFVELLELLTGIDGLVTDAGLAGGGQHQIASGGFLKVHADFNRHARMQLERRINVLLYLNRDWEPAWGGSLELWDEAMHACRVSVLPDANTLVVFNTTTTSYHGHPDPLRCPPDRTRRSLAFYYYTVSGAPPGDSHSTVFRDRPGEATASTLRERLRASAGHGARAVEVLAPRTNGRLRARRRGHTLFRTG